MKGKEVDYSQCLAIMLLTPNVGDAKLITESYFSWFGWIYKRKYYRK